MMQYILKGVYFTKIGTLMCIKYFSFHMVVKNYCLIYLKTFLRTKLQFFLIFGVILRHPLFVILKQYCVYIEL